MADAVAPGQQRADARQQMGQLWERQITTLRYLASGAGLQPFLMPLRGISTDGRPHRYENPGRAQHKRED